MKIRSSSIVAHSLVAVSISLIINFSYLLLVLSDRQDDVPPFMREVENEECFTGRLSLHPDGFGYIVGGGDSVFVANARINRMVLSDGDEVEVTVKDGHSADAHRRMSRIVRLNGEDFDYGALFNRPKRSTEIVYQVLYYLIMSFVLLMILTYDINRRNGSVRLFVLRGVLCLALTLGFYMSAPVIKWHTGEIVTVCRSGRLIDYVVMLKCSFVFVVSVLYAYVYLLMYQRQQIKLENERLVTENISTRYNMLVNQINPHFFFNSLNSLSMLVREGSTDKALEYIDRMSYTFRYILQNGQNMRSTLDDELRFAEAYSYLFKVRYADKVFFDTRIEERYRDWTLPALTLQPLMDNAIKHNSITKNDPLHISIYTDEGCLVVSNPKHPKIEKEPGTGIGLKNLRERWQLINGSSIEIVETERDFTVRMRLNSPDKA